MSGKTETQGHREAMVGGGSARAAMDHRRRGHRWQGALGYGVLDGGVAPEEDGGEHRDGKDTKNSGTTLRLSKIDGHGCEAKITGEEGERWK